VPLGIAGAEWFCGLLPICCNCKKIRDDKGYWSQLEKYLIMYKIVKCNGMDGVRQAIFGGAPIQNLICGRLKDIISGKDKKSCPNRIR
jgi:hypothetical protein